MRIEQHISKHLGQWHCHLYMTKEELEKQSKKYINTIVQLNDIIGIDNDTKYKLQFLLEHNLRYIILKQEYHNFSKLSKEQKEYLEKSIYDDSFIDYHIETIKCPNCNTIQKAKVIHKIPFYDYTFECEKCKYIITESEWENVTNA